MTKLCIEGIGCSELSGYVHFRGRGVRYDHLDILLGDDDISNSLRELLIRGVNAGCSNCTEGIEINLSRFYLGVLTISVRNSYLIIKCRDFVRLSIKRNRKELYVGPLIISFKRL